MESENVVAYGKMYRNVTGKKPHWFLISNVAFIFAVIASSALLGIFVAGPFWMLLAILFIYFVIALFAADEGVFDVPDDHYMRYEKCLKPGNSSARDTIKLLEEIFTKYPDEISFIISKDLLFNEVWDQVELSNIQDSSLHEYYMKLRQIKDTCYTIRKENLIAGRSASTDMVDLALETAKEMQK